MHRVKWIFPFVVLSLASAAMLASFFIDRHGLFPKFNQRPLIGHITRAYGTVRHSPAESWGRLETGRNLLIPLKLGDQLQTGDDSAAEILFFGGAILQLEPGTVVKFEDDDDDENNVVLRMIMGRGFLEMPRDLAGKAFGFRDSAGNGVRLPSGKRFVMTLSAVDRLEDAVDLKVVETDTPDSIDSIELRYLAHGEEIKNQYPVLVPPIEDTGRLAGLGNDDRGQLSLVGKPRPLFPERESEVDIEKDPKLMMTWEKLKVPELESVVAYEVVVKPAFNYEVQDTARRYQVFKAKRGEQFPIEKIGGGGVFLWSVRAVLASGKRSPSSNKRWLEIKFPKQLMAPQLLKPKIE
jgi:hypothetical protein